MIHNRLHNPNMTSKTSNYLYNPSKPFYNRLNMMSRKLNRSLCRLTNTPSIHLNIPYIPNIRLCIHLYMMNRNYLNNLNRLNNSNTLYIPKNSQSNPNHIPKYSYYCKYP